MWLTDGMAAMFTRWPTKPAPALPAAQRCAQGQALLHRDWFPISQKQVWPISGAFTVTVVHVSCERSPSTVSK